MTVYVDVLLGVNLLIDYLLLKSVALWYHLRPKWVRSLCGATVMAAGSLVLLLPDCGLWGGFGFPLLFAVFGVLATFGWCGWISILRLTAALFAITLAFGGGMTVLSRFAFSSCVAVKNSAVYLAISPFLLVSITLCCYGVLYISGRLFSSKSKGPYIQLVLQSREKTVSITAKIDTGFTLTNPYGNQPIILLSPKAAHRLWHHTAPQCLIPCNTVHGYGMLEGYYCNRVTVELGEEQAMLSKGLTAVAKEPFDGPFQALVGTDFIERCEWNVATNQRKNKSLVASTDCRSSRLHRRYHLAASSYRQRRESVDRTAASGRSAGEGTTHHP